MGLAAILQLQTSLRKKDTQYALDMCYQFGYQVLGVNAFSTQLMAQVRTNRLYRKGTQDTTKFLNMMGANGTNAKDGAVRNLEEARSKQIDNTPDKLLLAPVNAAVGALKPSRRAIIVKANDPDSLMQRKKKKWAMMGAHYRSTNPELFEALKLSADEAAPYPNAKVFDKMLKNVQFGHERTARQIVEAVMYKMNDWNAIETQLIEDCITAGIIGVKVGVGLDGKITLRNADVGNLITTNPSEKTLDDVMMIGEIRYMEPHEICMMNTQMGENAYPSDDFNSTMAFYAEAQNSFVGGNNGAASMQGQMPGRVVVAEFQWMDWQEDSILDSKGPETDPKKDMRTIRKKMLYECTWVVGSSYVLNFRPVNYTVRGSKDYTKEAFYKKCFYDYAMYAPSINQSDIEIVSLVQAAIPACDAYHIAKVCAQVDLENAKPTAYAQKMNINFAEAASAFRSMHQSGITIDMVDKDGNRIQGISVTPGGVSPTFDQYTLSMEREWNKIRQIMGMPPGFEASLPNADQGKAVTEMAVGSAFKGLKWVQEAVDRVIERVAFLILEKAQQQFMEVMNGEREDVPLMHYLDFVEEDILMDTEGFIRSEFDYTIKSTPIQGELDELKMQLMASVQQKQMTVADVHEIMDLAEVDYPDALELMQTKVEEYEQRMAKIAQENSIAQVKAQAEADGVKFEHEKALKQMEIEGDMAIEKEITYREATKTDTIARKDVIRQHMQDQAKIESTKIQGEAHVKGKIMERMKNADTINADKELGNVDIGEMSEGMDNEKAESNKPQEVKRRFDYKGVPYTVIVTNNTSSLWKFLSKTEGEPVKKAYGLTEKSGFEGFSNVTKSGMIFSVLNEAEEDFDVEDVIPHEAAHVARMIAAHMKEPGNNLATDKTWEAVGEGKGDIGEEEYATIVGLVSQNMMKVYQEYEGKEG
jgi:hypothetical protein